MTTNTFPLFAFEEVPVLQNGEIRLYDAIIRQYEQIESNLSVNYLFDKVTYASPVNFNESMRMARHRWFSYKEGFSPNFVRNYLNEFCSKPSTVLDPFAGVGTTLLEASRLGHTAYGFEVSPMSYEIARTKALSWKKEDFLELDSFIETFTKKQFDETAPMPDNQTVVSYYEPDYLKSLLCIKAFYSSIENEKIKSLFKLAFLNCLEKYSTHRKAGNGLKKKSKLNYIDLFEKPIEQIRQTMLGDLRKFKEDVEKEPDIENIYLEHGSCLDEKSYSKRIQFDTVLTSPPYANCFDYSKIYLVELWLGDYFSSTESQKTFRQHSLRSHVHARWEERNTEYGSEIVDNLIFEFLSEQKLWSSQIPTMIKGYFDDMGKLLHLLSKYCRSGAVVGLVVGNSYYGSLPIATDLLLTAIGNQFGFETLRIDVYRNIIVSSQQFTQALTKKYMRESLVILRKI